MKIYPPIAIEWQDDDDEYTCTPLMPADTPIPMDDEDTRLIPGATGYIGLDGKLYAWNEEPTLDMPGEQEVSA